MPRLRRLLIAAGLTAALTVPIGSVSASTSVTYALSGVEYAATSTQGSFTGVALASDDYGVWQAIVTHAEFDSNGDAAISGGTFALDGQVRDVAGAIVRGAVDRLTTSQCGKETFQVTGVLALAGGRPGGFSMLLTHYRFRSWTGRCITFFVTVKGAASFTLP